MTFFFLSAHSEAESHHDRIELEFVKGRMSCEESKDILPKGRDFIPNVL